MKTTYDPVSKKLTMYYSAKELAAMTNIRKYADTFIEKFNDVLEKQ
jgi:hypothetical protein